MLQSYVKNKMTSAHLSQIASKANKQSTIFLFYFFPHLKPKIYLRINIINLATVAASYASFLFINMKNTWMFNLFFCLHVLQQNYTALSYIYETLM